MNLIKLKASLLRYTLKLIERKGIALLEKSDKFPTQFKRVHRIMMESSENNILHHLLLHFLIIK